MSEFWIVIGTLTSRLGEIRSAQSWKSEDSLDRCGRFGFSMPATDAKADLLAPKLIATCYTIINGAVAEVGSGIIDEITQQVDAQGRLQIEVAGDSRLRELTNTHVGALVIDDGAGGPDTSGPSDIIALAPFGWALDTSTGYSASAKSIMHTYEGETVLAALVKLVELTGEHFRLGAGRYLVWMQNDRPDSGVRAVHEIDIDSAYDRPEMCLITNLEKLSDSYDAYIGRVYAIGSGTGSAKIDLNGASTGYSGYTVGSDSKGYYLQHTATWTAYGIERYLTFKDIADQDTLLEAAYEYLSRSLEPAESYKLAITGLQQTLTPGSTIRISYHRWIDGRHVIDVEDDLIILSATNQVDAGGLRTVGLTVSTIDRWPITDAMGIVDGMSGIYSFLTHAQAVGVDTISGDIAVDSVTTGVVQAGDGSNYVELSATGIVLYGTATVWDDVRVPAITSKLGGSKDPGFAKLLDNGSGSQGVFSYLFDASTEEELYFAVQLPHGYKQGSDITPHIHWAPVDTGTGTVRWGLEYSWANINAAFGTTTLIYVEDAGDGTAYKHQLAAFTPITGTGKTISSMLLCRVFRDAGHANDTYTSDAALLEIDFHVEIDTLGSETETSK